MSLSPHHLPGLPLFDSSRMNHHEEEQPLLLLWGRICAWRGQEEDTDLSKAPPSFSTSVFPSWPRPALPQHMRIFRVFHHHRSKFFIIEIPRTGPGAPSVQHLPLGDI